MAYVYNQNQDEQQQQGANIFGQPAQDGQMGGVEKTAPSGTLTAGSGMPLRGEYRGQQRTPQEVSQQAAQQRQARKPLQEIYRRNAPAQVGLPDFSKTMAQIQGAQTSAQEAAQAYTAGQLGKVETLGETDIPEIEKGTEAQTQKAMRVLAPKQANLTEPFQISAQVPAGLEQRFGTTAGLTGEVAKERLGRPGESRGATALDVSMLQKQPQFLQTAKAVVGKGKEVQKQQQELLNKVPEETRTAVQSAIDAAQTAAKQQISGKATTYEQAAKTAQEAYEKARGDIQAKINTGELSPEMAQNLSNWFEGTFARGLTDAGTKDYLRGFLAAPNREAQLREQLANIQSVGGSVPQFIEGLAYDPTQAFRARATPSELSAFMSEEQYMPYSRLKSLLGEAPVRAAAAPTTPLELTAPGESMLRDYLSQAAALRSGSQAADAEYQARKQILQNQQNELRALQQQLQQVEPVPGQLSLPYAVNPEYMAKQAALQQAFEDQTSKFSEARREQLRNELGLDKNLVAPPQITQPTSTPEWEKIVANMRAPTTSEDAQNFVPGQLSFPILI